MKHIIPLVFAVSLFSINAAAQTANTQATPAIRPRVIVVPSAPPTAQTAAQTTPTPAPRPTVTPTPAPTPTATPINPKLVVVPSAAPGFPSAAPTPSKTATPTLTTGMPNAVPTTNLPVITPSYVAPKGMLTLGQFRAKLTEAKRLLQTRTVNTALTDENNNLLNSAVTLALFDARANQLQTVTLPKTTFLTLYQETQLYTSLGKPVRLRTIRANGVNTAVVVLDETNQHLVPLVVQYPVERGGKFFEMAYYTSGHPTLLSSDIARAGQLYIRGTVETALKNLRERGVFIAPAVIAEAEKLCIVEHVDHQRFLTENRAALYNEIFTLFALNEGSTYRYAVSTAGAGGLVQMIPATYRMVRSQHPTVALMPDFVEGMRNHTNAMTAMLLYMQDTYVDLIANATIADALADGTANDADLMAAGYNSNPARLPLYIRRSGTNWRFAIPRETQMYLQIQASIDATVLPLPPVK